MRGGWWRGRSWGGTVRVEEGRRLPPLRLHVTCDATRGSHDATTAGPPVRQQRPAGARYAIWCSSSRYRAPQPSQVSDLRSTKPVRTSENPARLKVA